MMLIVEPVSPSAVRLMCRVIGVWMRAKRWQQRRPSDEDHLNSEHRQNNPPAGRSSIKFLPHLTPSNIKWSFVSCSPFPTMGWLPVSCDHINKTQPLRLDFNSLFTINRRWPRNYNTQYNKRLARKRDRDQDHTPVPAIIHRPTIQTKPERNIIMDRRWEDFGAGESEGRDSPTDSDRETIEWSYYRRCMKNSSCSLSLSLHNPQLLSIRYH